jgi:hypothetical protein
MQHRVSHTQADQAKWQIHSKGLIASIASACPEDIKP